VTAEAAAAFYSRPSTLLPKRCISDGD